MTKTEQIKVFLGNRGYDIKELKGQSLQSEILSRALNKKEALEALNLYSELEISILGR